MPIKRTRGRPGHAPSDVDRRLVETMTSNGIPQHVVAGIVGIAPGTLRKRYRLELDRGSAKANFAVARNLYRIATGTGREALTAALFWTKARMGWCDR